MKHKLNNTEELPKDWYIKVTEENKEILDKWRLSVAASHREYPLNINCYVVSKHTSDNSLFYNNTDIKEFSDYENYKEIDLPTFLKITNMQEEKPKEVITIINTTEAQEIINIACGTWKEKLAKRWSYDIIMGNQILVTDNQYKEMRNACTPDQHKLFDRIFGNDVENIPYGTPCLVRDNPLNLYKLAYSNGKGKYICSTRASGSHWSEVIPLTSLDVIPKLK